ncbi:MAG: alpha/beta fold hydrolase [Desulfovibrionaceae bacterium]|nr:alpha/beta fold hydrolase [Desulfovibrionaceae bacterium]
MKTILRCSKKALLLWIGSLVIAGTAAAGVQNTAWAAEDTVQKPIVLKTMGSFFFGGSVKTLENGVTFHGDHGYAQYYIPQESRNLPIIMWHGIGQSGKTFESTPDGREGYQAILTRRDWPVYIIDQPHRGRAGRTMAKAGEAASPTALYESAAWDAFRLGLWIPPAGPVAFPKVQMPLDGYTIDQFFRQQTPDTGKEPDRKSLAETAGKLLERTGPAILMTHSRSGQYGWATAMEKPDLVRAVVAYEPGHYVFPEGEIPDDIPRGKLHVTAMDTPTVPVAEFEKLTRMPILIVYGDNIARDISDVFNSEVWRAASIRGRQFVEAVNRHGGDARIVFLPDLGIRGNTHVPFADLNNIQVADQLEAWLHEKGLDKRDAPYQGPGKASMDLTIPLGR